MKIFVYESAYRIEAFDDGDFEDYTCYLQNIANIIKCFANDYIIVFPIEEYVFYNEEYEFNHSFVKDRIKFSKKFWIYNIPLNNKECPNVIWYKVENIKEIIEAIKIEQNFNCAVINQEGRIEDAVYLLNSNEDDEFNSLTIREKNEGDFINEVLPKLEIYLNKKIEIIDLR